MEPFLFIDKQNISKTLCDYILSLHLYTITHLNENQIENITNEYVSDSTLKIVNDVNIIIPLYPEESSDWFSITQYIIDKLESAIKCFIEKHSLNVYNMDNIIQNSDFLQANIVLYKKFDNVYHNDFLVTKKVHSTLSYIWCLNTTCTIVFGKSHTIIMEKGDLLLFPASWEYPYKLDADGIYLKGTLYTSYE